ncbi:hypothetical protein F511_24268 [Dorcoceras hygrometricum]|uniref:Uncharacterized protein n=1 Tax=Dorcoceras hygrometricum TaxID=472368 RepID=A0A2Z7B0R3_9LAMI|nr:hypothetical protein F511_24268 [Dorcoceras hygrometricum]
MGAIHSSHSGKPPASRDKRSTVTSRSSSTGARLHLPSSQTKQITHNTGQFSHTQITLPQPSTLSQQHRLLADHAFTAQARLCTLTSSGHPEQYALQQLSLDLKDDTSLDKQHGTLPLTTCAHQQISRTAQLTYTQFLVDWAVKMRIRPPELETSICDAKYHVSLDVRASGDTALSSPCWIVSHHAPSGNPGSTAGRGFNPAGGAPGGG